MSERMYIQCDLKGCAHSVDVPKDYPMKETPYMAQWVVLSLGEKRIDICPEHRKLFKMFDEVKSWLREKWWSNPALAPPSKDLLHAFDQISPLVIHHLIDTFVFVTPTIPNDEIAMARHTGHVDIIQAILEYQDRVRNPQKYEAMKGKVAVNAGR